MFKEILSQVIAGVMSLTLVACDVGNNSRYKTNGGGTVINNSSDKKVDMANEVNNKTNKDSTVNNAKDVKIKLSFNNQEVIVSMYDNPTSRDFLTMLPLNLTLEDYSSTEKISYLSKKLSTKDAQSGSDPDVGDLTYYAPWGNLAIFYKDFGYSSGLIKLGKIESGIEKFASVNGKFQVKIEKIVE